MAEQDINILDGIKTRLATYTATGQTLAAIKSYYVKFAESPLPVEFAAIPPALIVDMQPTDGEIVSIPACMTRKRIPVVFQVYTEIIGDTQDKTAAQLINLVEDVFHQQQLGISNLLIHFGGKSKATPPNPPFNPEITGGASLTYIYEYTDTRAVPA